MNKAEKEAYLREYSLLKAQGKPFFPYAVAKDSVMACVVMLVIILLSIFGVLTPSSLSRFRRFAIVLACIAGAILSPGADVISMVMMTVPLIFLYEVGFAGSVLVQRRKKRRAMNASTALGLALLLVFDSLPFRNDAALVFRRLIRSLPRRKGVLDWGPEYDPDYKHARKPGPAVVKRYRYGTRN